jgi:hypothetical protein
VDALSGTDSGTLFGPRVVVYLAANVSFMPFRMSTLGRLLSLTEIGAAHPPGPGLDNPAQPGIPHERRPASLTTSHDLRPPHSTTHVTKRFASRGVPPAHLPVLHVWLDLGETGGAQRAPRAIDARGRVGLCWWNGASHTKGKAVSTSTRGFFAPVVLSMGGCAYPQGRRHDFVRVTKPAHPR